MKFAVIGSDTSKSLSPALNNWIYDQINPTHSYSYFEIYEDSIDTVIDNLRKNKLDGFLESGNGFGATFTKIPFLRIDYILYDKQFSSSDFITHQEILSDHRAVSCKIKLD